MSRSRFASARACSSPREKIALRIPPPERPNPMVSAGSRRVPSWAGAGCRAPGTCERRSPIRLASAVSSSGGYATGSAVRMRSLLWLALVSQRLELGDHLEVFWTTSGPLDGDQFLEREATAFESE